VRVCVLGSLEVEGDGGLIPVGGPQARRVVARLALDAGRAVSVDALADDAWGEDQPATARHTIATHVLRLRRAGLLIDTVPEGYALRTPTDVDDFERLAIAARTDAKREPRRAARAYLRAIGLWRGEPFPELTDLAERNPVAARLDDQIATLREEWLAAELDAGEPAEWIGPSRDLTAAHPYRERGWQLLMLAPTRSTRTPRCGAA
jgi:DNA-binding SARP family transcriptional activator